MASFERPLFALLVVLATGCSVLTSSRIDGKGLASACGIDADCHDGVCEGGVCTRVCAGAADCPSPTACFANRCSSPLNVAAVWSEAVPSVSVWSAAHDAALRTSALSRPFTDLRTASGLGGSARWTVAPTVEDMVEAGATLVIGDAHEQVGQIEKKADDYPGTIFLGYGKASTNGYNFSTFEARTEQAWFIAGKVAARHATRRLGAVAGQPSPESVRNVNAFYLGARSVSPSLVLEVRWVGYAVDYRTTPTSVYQGKNVYREELLAAQLLAGGSEIVANMTHDQRVVRYVDGESRAGHTASLSISNISETGCKDSSGATLASCLGSVVLRWDSFYAEVLDQVHRKTWVVTPVEIPLSATDDSVISYQRNPEVDGDETALATLVGEVARLTPVRVFAGPYEVTGQRDPSGTGAKASAQLLDPGEIPSDTELETMCWFVKGVVEKVDPNDPASADVDALVPDAAHPLGGDALGPPGSPSGVGRTCHENE